MLVEARGPSDLSSSASGTHPWLDPSAADIDAARTTTPHRRSRDTSAALRADAITENA